MTETDRLSIINFGLPFVRTLPLAAGGLTQGSRQHVLSMGSIVYMPTPPPTVAGYVYSLTRGVMQKVVGNGRFTIDL